MNIEHTKRDTNAFLAENWHSWVVLFTVHRDRQLVLIRMPLCSHFHSTIVDHDVVSIESDLVVGVVIMGWEDQSTTIDHKQIDLRGVLDIHEQAETFGDCHTLSIDRRQNFSPGGFLRP